MIIRGSIYLFIALFVVVLPTTYLPFQKPKVLHDILGNDLSLLFVPLLGISFLGAVLFLVSKFLYFRIRYVENRWPLLLESFIIIYVLVFCFCLQRITVYWPSNESIYALNREKVSEQFVNPYLGVRMLDCRDISEHHGIIFLHRDIGIEHDYLAYSPKRVEKTMQYLPGKIFGDDWYWENTGSQWSRDLLKCHQRNKSPDQP